MDELMNGGSADVAEQVFPSTSTAGKAINGEHDKSSQLKQMKIPDENTRITLNLPAGLAFNDGVTYNQTNIGVKGLVSQAAIGSGIEEAVQGMKDVFKSLKGPAGKQAANIAQTMGAGILGEGVGGGVSAALRVTANPHTRVLFGSVPIRTFEFAFNFMPSSEKEAETVHNIIRSFRTELYPEGIAQINDIYFGYSYPDTYKIKFLYKGLELEDAPKLLDCYLTGVTTNYNPNQPIFFKDGRFTEITLALSFMEERTLFRQDIVKQYESPWVAVTDDTPVPGTKPTSVAGEGGGPAFVTPRDKPVPPPAEE
jgi:hypothetical protein